MGSNPTATAINLGRKQVMVGSGHTGICFHVVGDSITNPTENEHWPLYWEVLHELKSNWYFEYSGTGGAKAVEHGTGLVSGALQSNPDYILLALGTNDIKFYSPEQVNEAYSGLKRYAAPTPLWVTGPPEVWTGGGFMTPTGWHMVTGATGMNSAIAQLESDIPFTGLLGEDHYFLPIDPIHPDGDGHFELSFHVETGIQDNF